MDDKSRDAFQILDERLSIIQHAIYLRAEQAMADGSYVTSWLDGRVVVHSPGYSDDQDEYGSQVA